MRSSTQNWWPWYTQKFKSTNKVVVQWFCSTATSDTSTNSSRIGRKRADSDGIPVFPYRSVLFSPDAAEDYRCFVGNEERRRRWGPSPIQWYKLWVLGTCSGLDCSKGLSYRNRETQQLYLSAFSACVTHPIYPPIFYKFLLGTIDLLTLVMMIFNPQLVLNLKSLNLKWP